MDRKQTCIKLPDSANGMGGGKQQHMERLGIVG